MAAGLALLNNILEIRVDAAKVCYVSRRPIWRSEDNIGSWYTVMNVIGFVAIVTNATMVTMVGKLLAETEEDAAGGKIKYKQVHTQRFNRSVGSPS
jgi:hypothetical protein